MSAHTFSAEPKPYALVAIPSEAPRRMGPATHERFVGLTGHLLLEFTVVSEYLFVGSGDYGVDPSARGDRPDVWYTFSRRDGRVCVPGTSLKGAVRGLLEAISNSCVSQYRRGREEVGPSHRPCQDQQRLCPACRLFGRTGLRGRVAFGDGLPLGQPHLQIVKIAELWEPKRFTNARRFYEVKAFQPPADRRPQRNFRFIEAAPKGTQFQTTLFFENVTEPEMGLIFHALGWQPSPSGYREAFPPKMGGAKPRCLGAVRFTPRRLRLWGGGWQTILHPVERQGSELGAFIGACLIACQSSGDLFHRSSWRSLVAAMQPQSALCPREIY